MQAVSNIRLLSRDQKLALLGRAWASERSIRKSGGDHFAQYRNNPIEFFTKGLRQAKGESWYRWRVIIKAAFGLPLTDIEKSIFFEVANREPPRKRVKELWCIVGRRGGKDSVASLLAVYCALFADTQWLRPGETPVVGCFATSRDQAAIVRKYIGGYFDTTPALRAQLVDSNELILKNGVQIKVTTNNFRAPRGWPYVAAIFDEVAFWRDENSATPDVETFAAVRPGLAQIPGSMVIGISSPHKQSGLLYSKYEEHFGKDSEDVLVIKAPTRTMNPMIDFRDPGLIDKAYEEDPERAAAEYGAEFRKDLADYVSREVVNAARMRDVYEIAPDNLKTYSAFVDPSGGSRDSFTLAIGHFETDSGKGVLDAIRETRSPFDPSSVVANYAELLQSYRVTRIKGDHYAGVWPVAEFGKHGIIYEQSDKSKSDIYGQFLPLMNAGRVELLDNPRLIAQLCGLERRTVRGTGRDTIDHLPGAYDDVANAACGCLLDIVGDDRMAVIRRMLGA